MSDKSDDAGVHLPDSRLVPCDMCGSLELPEALEPAPGSCGRERRVCVECRERIEAEEREEAARDDFDARQHVDAESLGWFR